MGKHTYLRMRYFATGLSGNEHLKIKIKRVDESNYAIYVEDLVSDRWQTITLPLNEFKYLKPSSKRGSPPPQGEMLYQIFVDGAWTSEEPIGNPEFWIDDVVLFDAPESLPEERPQIP